MSFQTTVKIYESVKVIQGVVPIVLAPILVGTITLSLDLEKDNSQIKIIAALNYGKKRSKARGHNMNGFLCQTP